jgi:hypothetical protein
MNCVTASVAFRKRLLNKRQTLDQCQDDTPRHKGNVERGVDYVQETTHSVADTRSHGTTRQQVSKLFAEWERPALHHEGRR